MKARKASLNTTLALVLLAAPLVADAQQSGKVPTIGYLSQWCSSAEPPCLTIPAFLEGLKELGYVDGKNIVIEYRFTEGKIDRIPELAAELVRLEVEIIVTETAAAALRAKKATQTIPIVMGSSGDPVSLGLVASLAHPGGNVTGLSDMVSGLKEKSLQLITEVVPKLTHVGVLWDGVTGPVSDRE